MKYEPAYDGLRAISIFCVVVYHINEQLLPGGWAGVDVFFVLSGFLITSILNREIIEFGRLNYKLFYIKRFLRLGPALIAVVIATMVVGFLSKNGDFSTNYLTPALVALAYFMNWSRAFDVFPQGLLGHTWSLSMEEQFYICWPLLFMFTFWRRPLVWLSAAIIASTIWRMYLAFNGVDLNRTYNGFDTHADGLMIGCVVALLNTCDRTRLERIAAKSVAIPIILMIFIFALLNIRNIFTQSIGLGISAFLTAWLILAIKNCNWWRNFLSLNLLVYTGRLSYGWYLWHYPFLQITKRFFSPTDVAKIIIINIFIFCGSYLLAMMSFRYLEQPFLKLKGTLTRKIALTTTTPLFEKGS